MIICMAMVEAQIYYPRHIYMVEHSECCTKYCSEYILSRAIARASQLVRPSLTQSTMQSKVWVNDKLSKLIWLVCFLQYTFLSI